MIEDDDQILVFSMKSDSASLGEAQADPLPILEAPVIPKEDLTNTVIIGRNETLRVILDELPENVMHVYLAGSNPSEDEREELSKIAAARNLTLSYYDGDLTSEKVLLDLAYLAEHIVILNNHDDDVEQEADMEAILLLLNLRDIRTRYKLKFNITVEMINEHNHGLVDIDDHTDFLVASSISSLILAQLSESPKLIGVFSELLANDGNELYLKKASQMRVTGKYSFRTLRRIMLHNGYILLGYHNTEKHSFFNCPADEMITLTEKDELIVIGKD
jgi:hypothetical protein